MAKELDFEEGLKRSASNIQKEAQNDINKAQKYAREKNDEFEEMIREHPKSYVLGAFVAGAIVGALFSKGNK